MSEETFENKVVYHNNTSYYPRELVEKLQTEIHALENGFKGACPTCEPVGELNQKLEAENERLKKACIVVEDRNFKVSAANKILSEAAALLFLGREFNDGDLLRLELCQQAVEKLNQENKD